MVGRSARAGVGAGVQISAIVAAAFFLSSCSNFEFSRNTNTVALNESAPTPRQSSAEDTVWPTHGWPTSTPEAQGIDSAVLASALQTIRSRHIPVNSLLIERHGRIVMEAYFYPYTEERARDVYSVTKSVTSTLVGVAMADRKLDRLDASVTSLLPDAKVGADPHKERITLAHLLSMTSGLDCSDVGGRNYLQQMESSRHWTAFALSRRETGEPGSTFRYCAGNMHLVSAVLTRATGESAADYAREKLFAPLGIEDVSWPKDADGVSYGFANLKLSPRDMAKLGYLWLHHGVWDGKQIVPAEYMADAVSPHANVEPNVQYGYGMWVYPGPGHAGGPADFEANGFGGQRIAVIPSQDMVEVITGTGLDANAVASLLADAVKSDSALPENPIAYAALSTRVAAAQTGATLAIAASAAKPRHAFEAGATSLTAALAATVASVPPRPRPSS